MKLKGIAQSLILYLIGGAILLGLINYTGVLGCIGCGLTIISMSPETFISNDADLASANFLVTAVANGGGQSIVGTLSTDDISKLTGGKFSSQFPLKIEINALPETIQYGIQNDGVTVSKMTIGGTSCTLSTNDNVCPSKNSDGNSLYGWFFTQENCPFLTLKRGCYYSEPTATIGSIQPQKILRKAEVIVTINGRQLQKQIITNEVSSISIYDGNNFVATIKDVGGLITGNLAPDLSPYRAVYYNKNNEWKIASRNTYQSVTDAFSVLQSSKKSSGEVDKNDFPPRVGDYNSKIDRLISENLVIGGFPTLTSSNDLNNGKLQVTLNDRRISSTQFTMSIKASALGIYIPIGKPKIISASCEQFASGENGKITVTVSNSGTAAGTFKGAISCDTLKQAYIPDSIIISPLTSGSFDIIVDAGSFNPSSSTSKNCQISVFDVNNPSNKDTYDISCTVSPSKKCIPNSIEPEGNSICRCNSEGTQRSCEFCSVGIDYSKTPLKCNIPSTTSTVVPTTIPPVCTSEGNKVGGVFGVGKIPCCSGLIEQQDGTCTEGAGPIDKLIPYILLGLLGAIAGYYMSQNNPIGAALGGLLGITSVYLFQIFFAFLAQNILFLIIGGILLVVVILAIISRFVPALLLGGA